MHDSRNVFGGPLETCCSNPMTGWFRDGCCNTDERDRGLHVICAELTEDFLVFSKSKGNDLSTPRPEFGFPGLKPGDKWCLCAARWQEAFEAGCPPQVLLEATHEKALEVCDLNDLRAHAISLV
ncbi:MAG: DUF2237 domain-containing protein [Myxococcota bacterium]